MSLVNTLPNAVTAIRVAKVEALTYPDQHVVKHCQHALSYITRAATYVDATYPPVAP